MTPFVRPDRRCPKCQHKGYLFRVRRTVEVADGKFVEIVEVASDEDAETYRALGSPTVLVDGRDVDPDPTLFDYSADDRIYRTHRGPCGWPEPEWIRSAVLRAVAQTTSNGTY